MSDPVPTMLPEGVDSLEELLERARGIPEASQARLLLSEVLHDGEGDVKSYNLLNKSLLALHYEGRIRLNKASLKRELRRVGDIKARPVGRPRVHYKTKKKKHAEAMRRYLRKTYDEVLRKRRQTPEGAYEYLKASRANLALTLEEWVEIVWPELGEGLYTVRGNTLDNLLVVDKYTGKELFCGIEYRMRALGYIL